MRVLLSAVFAIAFFNPLALCGEAEKQDASKAVAAFEAAYELGAKAAQEKKWALAEKQFDAAIRALGETAHPKKAVAQILLTKARENAKQETTLAAADELLRLKMWAEAEAAYKKAAETLGETDAIKAGIAAAQAGAKTEQASAEAARMEEAKRKAAELALAKARAEAAEAKSKAAAEDEARRKQAEEEAKKAAASAPKTAAADEPAPIELPVPVALDRDQWTKGTGSACYWEGERLVLAEGDELFKKILTGDFAASIALEAQMDHRSRISIELRSPRDSGSKIRIIGWGSKEGSPPMLALDKDIRARGDKKPAQEQITLSFVRTGKMIQFYCDGALIGKTWDEKQGQPYQLMVSGKGTMYGAKVVER
ncbi:MAG TPA: hypothetical protein VEK08_19165 [Planctomycetota bacterium]|nr:hypothetical protein [Planctomycetota bacterium]